MASMQCYKPAEQTCYQGQYPASSMVETQIHCTSKTDAYYTDHGMGQTHASNPSHYMDQHKAHGYGLGHTHTQTHFIDQNKPHHGIGIGHNPQTRIIGHSHSSSGMAAAPACHKKRGERRHKSLIQKIKDGISGDDSSSDSESDDEYSGRTGSIC